MPWLVFSSRLSHQCMSDSALTCMRKFLTHTVGDFRIRVLRLPRIQG
jgi:hypothetical protein